MSAPILIGVTAIGAAWVWMHRGPVPATPPAAQPQSPQVGGGGNVANPALNQAMTDHYANFDSVGNPVLGTVSDPGPAGSDGGVVPVTSDGLGISVDPVRSPGGQDPSTEGSTGASPGVRAGPVMAGGKQQAGGSAAGSGGGPAPIIHHAVLMTSVMGTTKGATKQMIAKQWTENAGAAGEVW